MRALFGCSHAAFCTQADGVAKAASRDLEAQTSRANALATQLDAALAKSTQMEGQLAVLHNQLQAQIQLQMHLEAKLASLSPLDAGSDLDASGLSSQRAMFPAFVALKRENEQLKTQLASLQKQSRSKQKGLAAAGDDGSTKALVRTAARAGDGGQSKGASGKSKR